jgi:hypothetical protein
LYKPAADRVLVRPETARQPIVDHDHLRGVSSVALVKETAATSLARIVSKYPGDTSRDAWRDQ